jgi:hypothetical protein
MERLTTFTRNAHVFHHTKKYGMEIHTGKGLGGGGVLIHMEIQKAYQIL